MYTGGNTAQSGAGILMSKAVSKNFMGYWAMADRNLEM